VNIRIFITCLTLFVLTGYSVRYDAFNDELVAVNERVKGQFVVDKYLVKSFTVDVPGLGLQNFRKLVLNEFGQKERYFEVLYDYSLSGIPRIVSWLDLENYFLLNNSHGK
jgi:hypothetical protein